MTRDFIKEQCRMKKRKLSRWIKEAIETIGTIVITIAMGYAMLIIFGLFFC